MGVARARRVRGFAMPQIVLHVHLPRGKLNTKNPEEP
jgi:hypothetical protein